MARVPANPKIYHITHLDNLTQIVEAAALVSDAKRIELGIDCETVGMNKIKLRRLHELPVGCHPDTLVGQYVPFYFCPRSVMLYILHMSNHPDLSYRDGQQLIVHLQADMRASVCWADSHSVRWAFSNRNAGAYATDYFNDLGDLAKVNWRAVTVDRGWNNPDLKEGKQAEFLVYESFPWELVERIGVMDSRTERRVHEILRHVPHKPLVSVERGWYY